MLKVVVKSCLFVFFGFVDVLVHAQTPAIGVCEIKLYSEFEYLDHAKSVTTYSDYSTCKLLEEVQCKSTFLFKVIKDHVSKNWKSQPLPGTEVDEFYNWYKSQIRWECFPLQNPNKIPSPAPDPTRDFQEYRGPRQNPERPIPPRIWDNRLAPSMNPPAPQPNVLEKLWQYFQRVMEIAYKYRDQIALTTWVLILSAIALGLAASGPSAGTSLAGALGILLLLLLPYARDFEKADRDYLRGLPQALNLNFKMDPTTGDIVLDNIRLEMNQTDEGVSFTMEKIDPSRTGDYDQLNGTSITFDDRGQWKVKSGSACTQGTTEDSQIVKRDNDC